MTPARLKEIQARCEAIKDNFCVPCRNYCKLLTEDLPDCVAEIKRLQGVLDEIAGVPEKYKEA